MTSIKITVNSTKFTSNTSLNSDELMHIVSYLLLYLNGKYLICLVVIFGVCQRKNYKCGLDAKTVPCWPLLADMLKCKHPTSHCEYIQWDRNVRLTYWQCHNEMTSRWWPDIEHKHTTHYVRRWISRSVAPPLTLILSAIMQADRSRRKFCQSAHLKDVRKAVFDQLFPLPPSSCFRPFTSSAGFLLILNQLDKDFHG